MEPTQVLQSSSTTILEWLLIHVLTHLDGIPLSAPNVPLDPNILPPPIPKSSYGIFLVTSMDPLVILIFACDTPQTLSFIPPSVLIFKYGISRLEVHLSFVLHPQVGSQPSRFTISPIVVRRVLSSEDQKRLKDALIWVHPNSVAL